MIQPPRGDVLEVGEVATLDVSVVCPFFNEDRVLSESVRTLLDRLEGLKESWELILVDDGSTDGSRALAAEIATSNLRLRLLVYDHNRGRGHALRSGIAQARGAIIVTTEIDLSWGEDIVERLLAAVRQQPDADLVIASPHLVGGGYRNVPRRRVLLSRLGNWVIRASMGNIATMNTGMTRAYRRESIRCLPLAEDGKEFHLEVVLKARALGYRFHEIPALLEWKDYKHEDRRVRRKSSSAVGRLVLTHSLFSVFANPIRYVWGLSAIGFLLSLGFLIAGVVRLALGLVSVYMLIIGLSFGVIALMFFAFGVLAHQDQAIQTELWRLQRDVDALRRVRGDAPDG